MTKCHFAVVLHKVIFLKVLVQIQILMCHPTLETCCALTSGDTAAITQKRFSNKGHAPSKPKQLQCGQPKVRDLYYWRRVSVDS